MSATVIQDAVIAPKRRDVGGLADLVEAAIGLAAALKKNGQVWTYPIVSKDDGHIHVSLATPCRDSLDEVHNSPWVVDELARFLEHAEALPRWSARGRDAVSRTTTTQWEACDAFFLYTHAFDETSPVCAGDDGCPAPLYLLRLEPELREQLTFWAGAYKNHDRIWLDSRDLEQPAYEQLTSLESELTQCGRALAARVEAALETPTYYYLQRYYALEEGEEVRPCPGCLAEWSREADSNGRGLRWFDFKCDACRLVSHVGVSLD